MLKYSKVYFSAVATQPDPFLVPDAIQPVWLFHQAGDSHLSRFELIPDAALTLSRKRFNLNKIKSNTIELRTDNLQHSGALTATLRTADAKFRKI